MNIRIMAACMFAASLTCTLPAFAHPSSPGGQDSPASTATHARFGGAKPGKPIAASFICAIASVPFHSNSQATCPIYGNATVGAPCTCAGNSDPGVVKAAP